MTNCLLHNDVNPYAHTNMTDIFGVYNIIEKWSKEHPNEDE